MDMTSSPGRRRQRRRSVRPWLAIGTVVCLGLAACSSDDSTDAGDSSGTPEDTSGGDAGGDTGTGGDLADQVAAAEAEVARLTEELDSATAAADAAAAAADEAAAAKEELSTQLAAETERADEAEGTLEGIASIFPVTIDSSLDNSVIAGTWNIRYEEVYCDTYAFCGTIPRVGQATIATTPERFLRLDIPGILSAGLFSVSGSLYGITDSTQLVAPCENGPRIARLTVTLYADGVTLTVDGTRTVQEMAASITVASPNEDGCPGGLVFYGAQLTRAG